MFGKSKFYSVILLTICVIGFIFSGCDALDGFSSKGIQELLQPPVSSEENAKIKEALEKHVSGSFVLMSPTSGDYRSAYVVQDLDRDMSNEAIVFYKQRANMFLGFIDKNTENDSWVTKQVIQSEASDIYSISFCDFDNDSVKEILVMWERNDSQTMRLLEVYKVVSGDTIHLVGSVECSEALVLDLIPSNDDLEIVTLTLETIVGVSSQSIARLYTYDTDAEDIEFESGIVLNNLAIGYAKISAAPEAEGYGQVCRARVVVDSYCRDSQSMMTEMIYWSQNDNDSSGSLALHKWGTFERVSTVTSMDVNNDGLIDIPQLIEFANTNAVGITDNKYITDKHIVAWTSYDFEPQQRTIKYTVVNPDFNYMMVIPKEWIDDAALIENDLDNEYIIYKWDKEKQNPSEIYMASKVFTLSEWTDYEEKNKDNEEKYRLVKVYGSLVYAVRFGKIGYPGYYQTAIETIN
ncbi:MAG: hypothetical protein IKU25_06115 [Clostridia bacterium]|nr:hypothetical protein [Clostridia bacterium]